MDATNYSTFTEIGEGSAFFCEISSRKLRKEKAKRRSERRRASMSVYHYRYPVKLSLEQRNFLETMVHTSKTLVKHYLVARVLLMSDQSQGEPSHTDGQKALALDHQSS
jgi:hypothetical protein